jgi:hypothetical protein
MLGHGLPGGLLEGFKQVIDDSYAEILKTKFCIGIWCYACEFFEKHQLTGYYSGMMISEVAEAQLFGIVASEEDIKVSNESASFELQEIPAIRCASLREYDDRWILSCLFNYFLSICDLFNYLVSFFFCSSSCDKNAAQTFTQEPDDRNFLEVMFWCESWSVVSDH